MYITAPCDYCKSPVTRKKQHKSANVKRHFCNLTCKSEFQKLAKPVTKEWLEEHYINEGLDTSQIGILVSRDPKSVWNWLKDFGIPTRPRGGYTSAGCFQKGGSTPNMLRAAKYPSIEKPKRTKFTWLGRKHSPETRRRMSERAKAEGRVPYDPAVGSYMKGRKGENTPGWKGGISPERAAFYASPEWKKAASAVKKRDLYTCQKCGLKRKEAGDSSRFDIHHIVPFAVKKLRCVVSNLVYLCEPCHYWVHGKGNIHKIFIKEG